jgi:hypothetical protein
MNIYNKQPYEVDPDVSESIIRNARELPMVVIYADDAGNTAHGNSLHCYRYFDNEGRPVAYTEAEPFKLTGTYFVIKQGLLDIETPEV